MANKAYKAICINPGASEILAKGEYYWIRFCGDSYVYATRLHILSDSAHFGMYEASFFKIVEDEMSAFAQNETLINEQMSLF